MTDMGTGLIDPTLAYGLSGVNDWSPGMPFLDIMKQSRPMWGYSSSWENMSHGDLVASGDLDSDGWPMAIPDGMTGLRTYWAFPEGMPGAEGPFVLTWEGTGTITLGSLGTGSTQTPTDHRIEFDNVGGGDIRLDITATDPGETGDYVRNIRIVPAKYEALADAGEIFNPDWLEVIQDARQLRFMDWMKTNNSTQSEWADRPHVDDVSWAFYDNGGTVYGSGPPLEIMVALANKIGADPWFNMPHLATDEYVTEFAEYVRDNLNPALVAHVEWSNEVWNFSFDQSDWAAEQAILRWGPDPINFVTPNARDYQVLRAAQVAAIWDDVFAEDADTRVTNILGMQNGSTWWLQNRQLNAYLWSLEGDPEFIDPEDVFDAVATTCYFGGTHVTNSSLRSALLAQIATYGAEATYDWMADRARNNPEIDGSLPHVASLWASSKAVINAHGMKMVAYEGGQHEHHSFSVSGLTTEQINTLTSFMTGYVRSQQMADLYQELWDAWAAVGEGPFMQFVEMYAPTQYGSWGLRSNLTDDTPRSLLLDQLNATTPSWFGDGGGDRYLQGVIKLATSDDGETLTGTDKDDTLVGGDGDDVFLPGLGNDRMNGGKGNDTYHLGAATPFILDAEGSDTITSTISRDLADFPGIENLTLAGDADTDGTGTSAANVLRGNTGRNTLLGLDGDDHLYGDLGDDILDGGAGHDVLDGGADNDTYIMGDGHDTIVDVSGWDTMISSTSRDLNDYPDIEHLTLTGTANINAVGNGSANILTGNDGDNILEGNGGADTLIGGLGNDTYVITSATNDTIIDVGGNDTIVSTIGRDLRDYTGIENLTLLYWANGNATGTDEANVLRGNYGSNTLLGLDGDDQLFGDLGDDVLDGGAGNDSLDGGAGNDTYIMGDGHDTIVDASGWDTIISSISRDLNDYLMIENLTLTGAANIDATGNGSANILVGNDGNNVLAGNGGADTLIGGLGNDTYVLTDATNDSIIDIGGDDTITSTIGRDLRQYAGIENLTLLYWANINGTGTAGANRLTGNSGNNSLYGLGGDDILDGGAGSDILDGGSGNDTYIMGDGHDTIVDASGWDTMISSISRDLNNYAMIEHLTLTGTANINAIGNGSANILTGNDGNNILEGNGGADTLIGGLGNDTYVITSATNDTIIDVGGNDTIVSTIGRDLRDYAGIENLTLLHWVDATGIGTDGANVLRGNYGRNTLLGLGGDDHLFGDKGDDILDGGEGNDILDGGAGNDTYFMGDSHDTIIDASGWDTMISSISRDLNNYAMIEHLTLTGTANINAIGNGSANILTGNDGNNILDGNGGADTLIGGLGNDTYVITSATNDTIIDVGGNDTIVSTIGRDLRDYAGIENLTLLYWANGNATGTDEANVLRGNYGSNTMLGLDGDDQLFGDKGDDILDGGLGSDTLTGGEGRDTFRFGALDDSSAGSDRDVITDFTSGLDVIDLSAIASDGEFLADADAAFTGTENQIRWFQIDADGSVEDLTVVELDQDGDGTADFHLELSGLHQLTRGDFLL